MSRGSPTTLPGRLKLYFSQFLSFHFSETLSTDQIQYIENKKASLPFANNEEIADAVRDFKVEEKVWVVAAMMILKSEAEAIDDRVFSHKLEVVIKNITGLFGLKDEGPQILTEKKRLEEEALKFQNRKLILVPVSIRLLALDFSLRWVVLFYFGYFKSAESVLIVSNVLFIPLIIVTLAYFIGGNYRRRNHQLLERYGGEENFRIEFRISTSRYSWLALFLAAGVFIGYLLGDQLQVFGLAGLTLYYFVCIRFFLVGKIDENDLVKQMEGDEQNLQTLNRDENDEVIVALETKLNSLTGRLEAYVLESALFGALTFSGFLQIISSELVTFEALERFAAALFDASLSIISFDDPGFWTAAAKLDNKVSLFCLVSVESLICSVFFLAVIASRLRFSNVADRVRTAINLAQVYNAKEEAFYQEEDVSEKKSARLAALNAKVNGQLQATVEAMREVEPVMTYMQYFRNAGILVFLLILLSSTLFITTVVGWVFLALVLATLLYFNRQAISLSFKVGYLNLRIQFSRRSTWFMMASIMPFIIGLILRDVLFWKGARAFVAFGYLSAGANIFLWLLLAAHVDDEFGEIEKTDSRRMGRWKFVKNAFAGLIFLYCLGMSMKYLRLAGANEMVMISLSTLAWLLYFVGYYLSKIRWLGIASGGMLATFSHGILFKTLHLPGGDEMLLIGIVTLGLLVPLMFWQRKRFHVLFLKFCVSAFLLLGIFFSRMLTRLDIAISHRTWDIGKIMDVVDFNERDIKGSMERTNWYVHQYGIRTGYQNVYNDLTRQYYRYGNEEVLYDNDIKDSTTLPNALLLARQLNQIEGMFGYDPGLVQFEFLDLESNILLRMNRKEEALESVQRILATNPPKEVGDFLLEKVKEIESGKNALSN